MQERRAPHQHVQVLHCHGDSLKFARRHGHLTIYIIHRHIYIYVRVFLHISASLHDNAKLARVGVARAAPAHGLKYYITRSFLANNNMDNLTFILYSIVYMTDDSIWTFHLFDCESPKRLKESAYHA